VSRPDYSEWLTPERLAIEEKAWGDPATRTWPWFTDAIIAAAKRTPIQSIIEFGCGTGWVPQNLTGFNYVGVDANQRCIRLAEEKNPTRSFVLADTRTFEFAEEMYDLVCAFSFFKHFALDEWSDVVRRVLEFGVNGLFSVPIAAADKDDGTEFPHVWVTKERIEIVVESAEHRIVQMTPLPWGETLVETCRD